MGIGTDPPMNLGESQKGLGLPQCTRVFPCCSKWKWLRKSMEVGKATLKASLFFHSHSNNFVCRGSGQTLWVGILKTASSIPTFEPLATIDTSLLTVRTACLTSITSAHSADLEFCALWASPPFLVFHKVTLQPEWYYYPRWSLTSISTNQLYFWPSAIDFAADLLTFVVAKTSLETSLHSLDIHCG